MISDEIWDRFQEQYGVDGYTDSIVFIKLDKLIELDSQIESIKELLKSQTTITVTPQGYYSVQHIWPTQGLKIVEEIMRILFDQGPKLSEIGETSVYPDKPKDGVDILDKKVKEN